VLPLLDNRKTIYEILCLGFCAVIYRVSTKSVLDYKHLLRRTSVRRVSAVDSFSQQDGAPPHWGSHVRRFLNAKFPNRWIGRDGPTPWPPRSPDITFPPQLLFIWGTLRTKCFRHQFRILQI